MSSDKPKKIREDQRPVQVYPHTKEMLEKLRARAKGTRKELMRIAVELLAEQPDEWIKWKLGLLSTDEYDALVGCGIVKRAVAQVKSRERRQKKNPSAAG